MPSSLPRFARRTLPEGQQSEMASFWVPSFPKAFAQSGKGFSNPGGRISRKPGWC